MSFAIGDAALLAALALLGWYADTGDLAAALAATPAMPPLLATAIAALLLVAAAVRCGLPPFSRWLRRSMAAPTPVSALMHAGLVNAGGVLLIRFAPVLEAAPAIRWAAIALGAAAALFGTGVMLVRPDVKRGLAGSTVAQMGFMVMTCGFGAYAAAAWHLVAHGLFKAWLFLRAGSNIGAQSEAAVPALASGAVPAAALIASLAGALVIAEGGAGPELLPLLLAGATALALVLTAAASRQRATLLPMLALAALGNVGGLALLTWALDRSAPALPGANAAAFALAALLLLAWARQNAGRALPAPLYARLLAA